MASLRLILLGGFQVRGAGQEIDVAGRKERALLAVLAMPAGEPRSRDKLAGLLWSDRADNQARDSLKQAVFKLRKSFAGVEPVPLLADREFLSLERAAVAVDVAEFEQLIGMGTMEALARAAVLYRGDLLDGLDLRDAAFDEWLLMERQRLRGLACEALTKLVDGQVSEGAHDQAAVTARRLLVIDPLRESAHRALMQIYAAQGQTALALRQYQLCRDALARDLGVRPEADTEQLHRAIQEKRAVARQTPDQGSEGRIADEATPPLDTPSPLLHEPTSVAKPSIAVLPFANLSIDPEQEFFVDGLTEDIITALSRISALWVIARGSTFTYKGKPTNVKQVAQELGVRYVMEGSARRTGDRLRVTAQLIDAATGHHVWAERYDRPLADLFDIQDEITRSVAASTETHVVFAERQAAESRPSIDFKARDLVARAWARVYDETPEARAEASDLVEKAIRIDPSHPVAHRVRAIIFLDSMEFGEIPRDARSVTRALELARTAVRLSPRDEMAHYVMAWAYDEAEQLEAAVAACERGLEINPNCSLILSEMGACLGPLGRPQEAIEVCQLALQLNPRDPSNFWRHSSIAIAHFIAADYGDALRESKKVAQSRPFLRSAIIWAASAAALGKTDEARTAVEYCLAQRPDLRVGSVVPDHIRRFVRDEDHERLLALLRKAGLPE
jgi:TolB-like protein/DNA-binding SARP family transcriptional activator